MRTFIWSDTHFNHTNICGPTLSKWDKGYRNYTSLEEMNETLLEAINSTVDVGDELIHVGDFLFGKKSLLPDFLNRIRCKRIHLVFGNHDKWLWNDVKPEFKHFAEMFASAQFYMERRHNGLLVSIFHYPIGSWDEIGRGGVNLHGHCHSTYQRSFGCQLDVGVDCFAKPLLLGAAVDIATSKGVQLVDHHGSHTNYH